MKSSLLLIVAIFGLAVGSIAQPVTPVRQAGVSQARASLGKLPLYFVENRGVYADEVRYYIQGADKTLYFTDHGVTIRLKGKERSWVVKLDFVGANEDARPEGLKKQAAVFSYFKGPEKDWKAGLPSFSKVVYRDLWPGIDLIYNGTVNKLKYEFVVAPGADPKQIRLRYRGVVKLERTKAGALKVTTPEGSFEDAPPVAWQEIDGERVAVRMAYAVGEDGAFVFDVGEHDESVPLVLDPAVIVYCGYIGGNSYGADAAVDAGGNLYVAGWTASDEKTFPVRVGPDLTFNGGTDTFVAKVRPDGRGLVYCGYVGGSGGEAPRRIAIDGAGNAYICGITNSTEATFPVKIGPDLTYNGGGWDVFVAKVNSKGTALIYCGYIGGGAVDQAGGIAVDSAGRAYVCGDTQSSQTTFPVKVGPDLTYNGGGPDVFVTRVNATGSGLDYCGYIGGSGRDGANRPDSGGIAVDTFGSAYVCGSTRSTAATFPVTVGPDLTYNGGTNIGGDAFVAKVNPKGTALVFCGYIGGIHAEEARGVAVDAAGRAHVTGSTHSSEATFPVVVGPDLTINNSFGPTDVFVTRVNSKGTALDYCGYIGGSNHETPRGIALDIAGNAYIAGVTYSSDSSFPVKGGPDLTYNGGTTDGFMARVRFDGRGLDYSGYIGGSSDDEAYGVAVDAAGTAYVAGSTMSTESSFPVQVGPSLKFGSNPWGAFVAKVAFTVLEASGTPRPGGTVNLTLTSTDDAGLAYILLSSFGVGPIKIGNRTIGVGLDPLLMISANNEWPTMFHGYQGFVSANGRATAKISVPTIPALIGQRVHTAFVTINWRAPQGIKSISNTYSFTITK